MLVNKGARTETVHPGRLLFLSGIFWNVRAPSSYMQPCLFIKPSCRDVYYNTPFVSIKIGKFSVISEVCLHIKYDSPLKFVSSHIWHLFCLCLNCLFVLTNSHLPVKKNLFLVREGYMLFFHALVLQKFLGSLWRWFHVGASVIPLCKRGRQL